ncbi:hypothetical protein L3V59_20810 [Burkholderia aenigmatica]|uniref:hypothetical protein n=1 Tax=Burkholderia aenigmatica TaxID=2015348 RepID=UPI001F1C21D2|nr:hypothetical protein [Burkholderia aenigmatica]UKD16576.1 hypothetical protein L3V59_20810 [Burkholderia aenigmatica]
MRIDAARHEAAAVEKHGQRQRPVGSGPVQPCGQLTTRCGNLPVLFGGDGIARRERAASGKTRAIRGNGELREIDRGCLGERGEQRLRLWVERHGDSCLNRMRFESGKPVSRFSLSPRRTLAGTA